MECTNNTKKKNNFNQENTFPVTVKENIAYKNTGNIRHVLDLFYPGEIKNYPVLMFVSGGGWSSGSKTWVSHVGYALASKGMGMVLPDHRLFPGVPMADQVEDLACAFRWIKRNISNYGGNDSLVLIGGHSAGAHLTGLLATDTRYLKKVDCTPGDISGVIAVSGAFDISKDFKIIEKTAPLKYVKPGLPPFLIITGDHDFPEIASHSRVMSFALEAAGNHVELRKIKGRDHFKIIHKIGTPGDETTKVIESWLAKIP